ncbi:hypothetical protein B7494_g5239 [Chlorociboria aeruginascens]|nr:hypothetical protein B7494_g5239 [Chlorociboria aeruginascens]
MEQYADPVGDSSARRTTRSRQQIRQSLAESPPEPKSPQKKRRKSRSQGLDSQLWAVRNIVGERKSQGQIQFLIDWENDPQTGRPYSPTWEPYNNVNTNVITEWETRKEQRKTINLGSRRQSHTITLPQESPNIRPAKRRRTVSPSQHSHKKLRRGTVETVRFSVSHESEEGKETVIKDSYEQDQESTLEEAKKAIVEIPPAEEGFDPDAYTKITSSQLSTSIHSRSQSISQSQFQTPVQSLKSSAPYISSEDLDEQVPVIPDSQEGRGSPACDPSQTRISDIGPAIHSSTATDTAPELEDCTLRQFQSSGSSARNPDVIESQLTAASLVSPPNNKSLGDPSGSLSTQPEAIIQSQTEEEVVRLQESRESLQGPSKHISQAQEQNYLALLRSSKSSTPVQDTSPNPLTSRAPSHQPSQHDFSEADQESGLETQTQFSPVRAESNTLNRVMENNNPSPTIENPVFNFEATWDASKEISQYTSKSSQTLPTAQVNTPQEDTPPQILTRETAALTSVESSHIIPTTELIIEPDSERHTSITDSSQVNTENVIPNERPLTNLEKIKAARRHADARAANPSISPIPIVANQTLPLRETVMENPVPVVEDPSISKESVDDKVESTVRLRPERLPYLGQTQFIIPLSMIARVRDIYLQTIENYRKDIVLFMSDEEIYQPLVDKMDTMIDELERISDHVELFDEDSSTQKNFTHRQRARLAEDVSPKCTFLRPFLEELRPFKVNIIILVRSNPMLDVLTSLMREHKFNYIRPDLDESIMGGPEESVHVTLLTTDTEWQEFLVEYPSVVIALDSTFNAEHSSRVLQPDGVSVVPILFPVTHHTSEHLQWCIPKDIQPVDRKTMLVNYIVQLRKKAGMPIPDYDIVASAKIAASFVVGQTGGLWPLSPMPDIEGLQPVSESEPKGVQSSTSTIASNDTPSRGHTPQTGFKRSLVEEVTNDSEPSKRQRLTPIPDTQSTTSNMKSANSYMPQGPEEEASNQVTLLLGKVADLENEVRARDATEAELRQRIDSLEARCTDYESSIQAIQPKYREALNDQGQFKQSMDLAVAREKKLNERYEARVNEITKLREEKTALTTELTTARDSLSTLSIPEIAEANQLKEELRKSQSEIERSQKRYDSLQQQMEYTREHYQQASTAAADANRKIHELEEERILLLQKSSENSVLIHHAYQSNAISELTTMNNQLRAELKERDRCLDKAKEDLRLLGHKRATRGTSIPRSPRMVGVTSSPRPTAMRVLSGIGSRSSSPAPGESPFRTILPGTEQMLQQGGPTTMRWHMQN